MNNNGGALPGSVRVSVARISPCTVNISVRILNVVERQALRKQKAEVRGQRSEVRSQNHFPFVILNFSFVIFYQPDQFTDQ